MKASHLLASFAVATVASAAELKDPAEVIREWNEAAALSPGFLEGDGLTLAMPKTPVRISSRRRAPARAEPGWGPIPRNRIYDAPNYTVPEELPDNMPAGTVIRKFGGTTYYVMPAIPAREK